MINIVFDIRRPPPNGYSFSIIQNERLMKMGISMLHAISFQIVMQWAVRRKEGVIGGCVPALRTDIAQQASGPMRNCSMIKKEETEKGC
jgi:hypothetical protein